MKYTAKFLPPLALVGALALVSRTAPPAINATMMGGAFLVLFVANNLIGWIGTFYEQMGPLVFWGLHAGIGAAGGVLAFLYSRTAGRMPTAYRSTSSCRPKAA